MKIVEGWRGSAVLGGRDDCYRYRLERTWSDRWPGTPKRHTDTCLFIMLNPSTATADVNDPSVRRCMGYARSWGASRLLIGNAYAFRATDPQELKTARKYALISVVGPQNDKYLGRMIEEADLVVCAWGTSIEPERQTCIYDMIPTVQRCYLQLTKGGVPRHPLYLPGDLDPSGWA